MGGTISSEESPVSGARAPRDAWVLRLVAADGSSWLEGVFGSAAEARDRAASRARSSPVVVGGCIWEYRFGQVVSGEQLSLDAQGPAETAGP